MIRVAKGTSNFLRNSLALTRKAIYWGNKEIQPSKLTSTNQEKDGVSAEVSTFGENSTSTFFLGTKELRTKVIVSESSPSPTK